MQACLIADIVQHFVDAQLEFDASYVYQDVNRSIQHVHQSGLVHQGILSDPHRYLVKNVSFLNSLCSIHLQLSRSCSPTHLGGHFLKHCSELALHVTAG